MSQQVTTAFVKQFGSTVQLLSQQKKSRLRSAVRVETIMGEEAFYDQIGEVAAVKKTNRHGDTPLMNTPHARRRVATEQYEWADLIDKKDQVKTLVNLTNAYTMAAGAAMGRAVDEEIIRAADGVAYTGKTGATSVAFDTNNEVAVNHGGSNSQLTVAKLREAKLILDAGDVDPDMPRYCIINARQADALLANTEITSSDYNTVKALVQGQVDTFLGFKFIMTNLIDQDENDYDKVLFWAHDGLLLAEQQNLTTRISERDDKSYSTQVYVSQMVGATRMEEAKVGRILCTQTAS